MQNKNSIRLRMRSCATFVFVSFLVGCQPPTIETGYGRSSGPGYTNSLNGTSVLHQMLKTMGFSIDRYSKMSPRWDSYQTVFWMPDTVYSPSENHIQWAESWLRNGNARTLVYVARDYDGAVAYWNDLCQQVKESDTQRTELRKKMHEHITGVYHDQIDTADLSCLWFRYNRQPDVLAKVVSGPLVDGLDAAALDLRYGDLPQPGSVTNNGEFGIYDVEVWLTVDQQPMVYQLKNRRLGQSQIIIVGNASFLLNLPLANPANQELASNFICLVTENNLARQPSVLFIENDGPPPILEHDVVEAHSAWNWITKQPLRYIVPNILFCSMLFCFVYFPVFGRARKVKPLQSSNFRDHVDALGQLIKRTGSDTEASSWIELYQQRKKHLKQSRENVGD